MPSSNGWSGSSSLRPGRRRRQAAGRPDRRQAPPLADALCASGALASRDVLVSSPRKTEDDSFRDGAVHSEIVGMEDDGASTPRIAISAHVSVDLPILHVLSTVRTLWKTSKSGTTAPAKAEV